jgi:hypothetical protein
MLTAAVRVPLAVGVKVTLIVHLAPAATELPQVLVWAKSPAVVPVIVILAMLRAALPVLLRVAVWAALVVLTDWRAKVRLVGERLAAGAVPVPERATVWGLPLALSLMLTQAVRVPLAVGVKVTLIVPLAPAATELPQVLVWAKSPASVPVTDSLVISKTPLPTFPTVTVWAALVVPAGRLANESVVGERLICGRIPTPVRLTFWRAGEALSEMMRLAMCRPLVSGVKVILIVQLAPAATDLPQLWL